MSGPRWEGEPIPADPSGPPVEDRFSRAGFASYRNFTVLDEEVDVEEPALCEITFLPDGTRITVENTDNGKRVECIVNRTGLPPGVTVVLDSALFVELADLSDAPIPVRIRW
jgi:hypothetical protein